MPVDILSLVIGTITEIAANPALAKLDRSERVNRVLQRFGIEHLPGHPDFETVYAHSLVHYGVDKPSHVLDIFRDDWVKGAFKVYVYDTNTASLEKEIDTLVARNVEAGNTRYARVNVQAELLEFEKLFWSVVHKTRTPAELENYNIIKEMQGDLAKLRADLARILADRIEQAEVASAQVRSEEDHAEHMKTAMQEAIHTLACQTVEEERLYSYFASGSTINILRDQVFSILDAGNLPVQVKYGIATNVDYDLLRKQVGTLVVNSFDRNKAAARVEEVVLSLIDIGAIVSALTDFIQMKTIESDGDKRVESLAGEIERMLVPFINDAEFRTAISQAAETGLPDPLALGTQIHKLCGNSVIAAAERL